MVTMNVSLPEPMKNWIESQIDSGAYANYSDYIRDLVRRDQVIKKEQEILLKALIEGEKSGISEKTIDDIWASVKARYNDEKL